MRHRALVMLYIVVFRERLELGALYTLLLATWGAYLKFSLCRPTAVC